MSISLSSLDELPFPRRNAHRDSSLSFTTKHAFLHESNLAKINMVLWTAIADGVISWDHSLDFRTFHTLGQTCDLQIAPKYSVIDKPTVINPKGKTIFDRYGINLEAELEELGDFVVKRQSSSIESWLSGDGIALYSYTRMINTLHDSRFVRKQSRCAKIGLVGKLCKAFTR